MPGRHWPLVVFTVSAQAAAGLMLALAVMALSGTVLPAGSRAPAAGALGAVALVLLGSAVSLTHLGKPLRAVRSGANAGTSWLSREAILSLTFAGLAAAAAAAAAAGASAAGRTAITVVAAGAGMLLVHAMARLYRLRTVPSWDTWYTPVSFFLTALVLGCTAAGLVAAADPEIPAGSRTPALAWLAAAAASCFAAEAVAFVLWRRRLRPHYATSTYTSGAPPRGRALQLALRWVAGSCSVALLAASCAMPPSPRVLTSAAALALALLAEMIGRSHFYAAYRREGL